MSGHSKWHKVKHKKAITDGKKSKNFGRFSREIKVAARGGKDPHLNASLRDAIERAKRANVPQANIDRLLSDTTDSQQSVTYEGYGTGGVAVLVNTETDNTNRTVSELRALFKKHGGSLGEPGSVRWKFMETVTIEATTPAGIEMDTLELSLIDAGAATIDHTGPDTVTIIGPRETRSTIEKTITNQGLTITTSFATHTVPDDQRLTLPAEQQEKCDTLVQELTEHADVIDVHTDAADVK